MQSQNRCLFFDHGKPFFLYSTHPPQDPVKGVRVRAGVLLLDQSGGVRTTLFSGGLRPTRGTPKCQFFPAGALCRRFWAFGAYFCQKKVSKTAFFWLTWGLSFQAGSPVCARPKIGQTPLYKEGSISYPQPGGGGPTPPQEVRGSTFHRNEGSRSSLFWVIYIFGSPNRGSILLLQLAFSFPRLSVHLHHLRFLRHTPACCGSTWPPWVGG